MATITHHRLEQPPKLVSNLIMNLFYTICLLFIGASYFLIFVDHPISISLISVFAYFIIHPYKFNK